MTLPTFVAAGTAASGANNITPGIPAGVTAGDLMLMFVETNNQTVTASAGWSITHVPLSTGSTRNNVFSRIATASETAPTLSMGTVDHMHAVILAFRHPDGAPEIAFLLAANGPFNQTNLTGFVPSRTMSDDNLIVVSIANPTDTTVPQGSNYACASLANITEIYDGATDVGGGGGLSIFTGEKATKGDIVAPSASFAISARHSSVQIALAPKASGLSPYIKSVGEGKGDQFATTLRMPPDFDANDTILLLVETANETITAPTNFSDAGGVLIPQGMGTAAAVGSVRLTVFSAAGSALTRGDNISLPDIDHTASFTLCISTPDNSVPELNAYAGDTAAATTAVSIPSVSTTKNNALVLAMVANATDITTDQITSISNTVASDEYYNWFIQTLQGVGGGINLFSATIPAVGGSGAFTGTLATSSAQARISLAFVLSSSGSGGPAGGVKVWSGSAWVEKPAKVWTGSAWTQKPVKVWNGSAWT